MRHLNYLLAACASGMLASCSLLGPSDPRLAELTLVPSDSVVAPPAVLLFEGVNDSGTDLLWSPCDVSVHRRVDSVWSYSFGGLDLCGTASEVPAGGHFSFAIPVAGEVSAGTYRAQLRMMTGRGNRTVLAVSTPFRIQ